MNHSRDYLEMQVTAFGRDHAKLAGFILDHGRAFEADAKTFKGRRMRAKNCFGNCIHKVLTNSPDLTYVEGYVQALIPIHHAWLMRKDGSIIDPTLSLTGLNGTARDIGDYFGVPFKADYVMAHIAKTRTYGLLDGMSRPSVDLITGNVPPEEFLAWTS
jgi:hypothetical protein